MVNCLECVKGLANVRHVGTKIGKQNMVPVSLHTGMNTRGRDLGYGSHGGAESPGARIGRAVDPGDMTPIIACRVDRSPLARQQC